MFLLVSNRRLILSGSCGTGKTYLARKLADYLIAREDGKKVENVGEIRMKVKQIQLEEGGGAGQMLKQFVEAVVEQTSAEQRSVLISFLLKMLSLQL